MKEETFTLPDGRKLGYACYGPPQGRPVLYFHGTPSSRLEPGLLHAYGIDPGQLLRQHNLHLIAVERPGMGLSTFNPAGTLLSFAEDVASLAVHLHLHSCPVLCWSGGGPYALAMAKQFPQLIPAVFILCGFTRQFTSDIIRKMHLNKWYFQAARHVPHLLAGIMSLASKSDARHSLPQWLTGLPDADYVYLKSPAHLKSMAEHSLKEACRNSARGAVHEARVYFQDFGYAISEIRQPVHYWWGTSDRSVIRPHMEAVATQIPSGKVHLRDDEGHISLYVKCFAEVLQAVAAAFTTGY